jgi:hypothetical protein
MVATLASLVVHRPSLVTSFVVLSLRVAVAVSWVTSPMKVNVNLPVIETRESVGAGVAVGVGTVGAVGGLGSSFPQ